MRTIRPTHPLTGRPIQPLGRRKDGRLIWPIMGGSEAAGGDAGGDGSDAGADAGPDAEGDAGDQGSDAGQADDAEQQAGDDSHLQREVARLRKEAANTRVKAKQEKDDLVQNLGKALGFVKDGDDSPSVDQLTQQLTQQAEHAKAAQVELALYKASSKHNADPDLLAAVLSHKGKLADLDPADAKFDAALEAVVKEAVDSNPKLKATAQAAGSSSADHGGTGGGTTSSKPKSLADSVAANYGT